MHMKLQFLKKKLNVAFLNPKVKTETFTSRQFFLLSPYPVIQTILSLTFVCLTFSLSPHNLFIDFG